MNAFISYSISENEQYILSLLAQKVAETGLTLVTSYNQSDSIDLQTTNEIKNSVLFIGLVTRSGRSTKTSRVYSEFKQANLYNKPAILLIEENAEMPFWTSNYQNTIKFNRHYINQAVEEVKKKIQTQQISQSNNAAAWILGGVAVLALLSYLDDKK